VAVKQEKPPEENKTKFFRRALVTTLHLLQDLGEGRMENKQEIVVGRSKDAKPIANVSFFFLFFDLFWKLSVPLPRHNFALLVCNISPGYQEHNYIYVPRHWRGKYVRDIHKSTK
jgi:hypothetical protein